jgi:anti-anti-sigma factor
MTTTIDLAAGVDDGVIRIRLAGDVDFYSAADLRRLAEAIEDFENVREIRVHLERVEFLSAEGLGALTHLAADASECGLRLQVMGARGQAGKLIRLTGADRLLGGDPLPRESADDAACGATK